MKHIRQVWEYRQYQISRGSGSSKLDIEEIVSGESDMLHKSVL